MSNWVWHSTEASRTEGTVSILAIIETLFFVLLTWGVAVYFNFYYYLFAPLVLTPFLMLKTSESVELAHHIFLYDIDSHSLSKRFVLVISAIISLIILIFLPINSNLSYLKLIVSFLLIFLFVLVFVTKIVLTGGKNAIEKSVNEFLSENKYIAIFSSIIFVISLYYTDKLDFSDVFLMVVIGSLGAISWDGIMSGNILIIRSLFIKIFVTLEREVFDAQFIHYNIFQIIGMNRFL
ncbi:hypothetical protein [Sulfuricurvum sp.]|uniref:hypothetical protein n=1 Tax=Sulfuricurvum sp. TaxID=2025608 RepID=UPI002620ADE9|nr:hypothetical protein [Sulfuricurvum sp.]MDD4883001.1 hypothetical protein [Sulfuricurvum sp.]